MKDLVWGLLEAIWALTTVFFVLAPTLLVYLVLQAFFGDSLPGPDLLQYMVG